MSVDARKSKQKQRQAEFRKYGIKAEIGQFVGQLVFSATEAEKLLKLLRKLEKLEERPTL